MATSSSAGDLLGADLGGPEPKRPSAGRSSVGDADVGGGGVRGGVTYGIMAAVSTGTDTRHCTGVGSRPGSPPSSPSATLAVDAKAKALQAAGEHVIGFGAGEPDFPTPDHIVEAAVGRLPRPRPTTTTRPTGGLPELREAIAAKTERDSGLRGRGRPRCW